VDLFVETAGQGDPLLLMHGGPGLDHWTLEPLRRLAGRHTLVFYDHRCNGRSYGPPLASMTFENLTADAEALRIRLGIRRWAVLGHSFGGYVALEYALRYPESLSSLVLMDTAARSSWATENASRLLIERGWSPERAEYVRRWFNGEFEPREMLGMTMRLMGAYSYKASRLGMMAQLLHGRHMKLRTDTFIYSGRHMLKGWSVVDRLGEIGTPTLVLAGRSDFVFPPAAQAELSKGIAGARLQLIDRAGHSPHVEQPAQVVQAINEFLGGHAVVSRGPAVAAAR